MSDLHSQYGALANIYDGFLTLTGFKRGVENFFNRIDFTFPKGAKIMDAGTGTGIAALYLARRFPDSEILATDIDERMLGELRKIADEEGIKNVSVWQNDFNFPAEVRELGSIETKRLSRNSFDAIFTSGILEHVDIEKSIPEIASLLKPGGIFLNLGVKRNPAGAVLGMLYNFEPHSIREIQRICGSSGLTDIRMLKLTGADFPANLSRVAIFAKKQ